MWKVFQNGPFLVFWRVKGKKGGNTFSLARFVNVKNLTIKIELVLMLVLLVWTTLEG